MRWPICTAALALVAGATILGHAQTPPSRPGAPASGTRGNPDNVPFIGRRDAKGNPVRLAKATGHVSNYSEDKVRPYTLPDPLILASGERVTSADRWFQARRPEILKFYRDEIYGHVPAGAPRVTWEVAETEVGARGGTAVRKRVVGRMGDKPDAPRVNLTVYLPARASEPVPLLLNITFGFGPGRAVKPPQRPDSGRPPRRGKPRTRSRRRRKEAAPACSTRSGWCSTAAGDTPRCPTARSSRIGPTGGPKASSG